MLFALVSAYQVDRAHPADIIGSVALQPTFRDVGVLAVIVLIRTFLSFSLEIEITGRFSRRRSEPVR